MLKILECIFLINLLSFKSPAIKILCSMFLFSKIFEALIIISIPFSSHILPRNPKIGTELCSIILNKSFSPNYNNSIAIRAKLKGCNFDNISIIMGLSNKELLYSLKDFKINCKCWG